MGRYGTDLTGLGAFEGGINTDKGANIISTDSVGEKSLLFSLLSTREIQAGVVNGDFSVPPDAAGDTITEENPLPYWTFTDVSSAGAITAAIVADAGAASGNVLRFTVASGTLAGKSATLTRFVPVASSASRSFSFYAEATFDNATNSTQANAKLTCQFYKSDGVTTTGIAFESLLYGFDLLQTPTGITAPDLWETSPDLTDSTAPADAAYLKITITIATVATQSANRVVDLTEVRVGNGLPELILTDKSTPTNLPAYIINDNNELSMYNGSQSGFVIVGDETLVAGAISATVASLEEVIIDGYVATSINSGIGPVNITAPSGVNITTDGTTAGTVTVGLVAAQRLRAATTAEVTLSSTTHGFQVGPNAGANLRMDGNEIMAANNGVAADLFLQDQGGDVYIGDAATSAGDLVLGTSATSTTGAIVFKNGTGGSIRPFSATSGNTSMGVYNSSGSAYTALVASGFYPSQGSSFLGWSGTNFTMNDTLDVTGVVFADNFTGDTITGTTATTNAAIWVLTAGTTYNLRRNTSSARYKTNIVDADDAVLEAARKIKPRHFTSTIEDEAGATRLGFIAEEVEAAGLTHAVGYDAEGRVDTIDSVGLIAALFARVNDLEERLAKLESR